MPRTARRANPAGRHNAEIDNQLWRWLLPACSSASATTAEYHREIAGLPAAAPRRRWSWPSGGNRRDAPMTSQPAACRGAAHRPDREGSSRGRSGRRVRRSHRLQGVAPALRKARRLCQQKPLRRASDRRGRAHRLPRDASCSCSTPSGSRNTSRSIRREPTRPSSQSVDGGAPSSAIFSSAPSTPKSYALRYHCSAVSLLAATISPSW